MRSDEKFSHTYMERFWPKKAWDEDTRPTNGKHLGIRYEYGDLLDLIGLLSREPYTRQAFLPVWFPEDTGSTHGGRVPCTLGYHFIRRGNHFHMVYYIRSCDFFRHFRDDIYLGVRLLYWILNNLEIKDQKGWRDVKPGIFTMHITSLHIFNNEYPKLLKP
jgi:thymidylate synthase